MGKIKHKNKQNYGMSDVEKSCLTCHECSYFENGRCTNGLFKGKKHNANEFHFCLQPKASLLSEAIESVKRIRMADTGSYRKQVCLAAIIDRYEGAPRKQVSSDYSFYMIDKNTGKKKDYYTTYIRHALGVAASYMQENAEDQIAALAKWILDDYCLPLFKWNPFMDSEVEELKKKYLKKLGETFVQNKYIKLDGEEFTVLDQEKGNLFVVQTFPTMKEKGYSGAFYGSNMEETLNVTWLNNHPEVKKRLLHRVRILTAENLRDYYDKIVDIDGPFWLAKIQEDLVFDKTMLAATKASPDAIVMMDVEEEAYIRPAFWISPSEQMIEVVKENITASMNRKDILPSKKEGGESHPLEKVSNYLPADFVTKSLEEFAKREEQVYEEDAPEDTKTVMRKYLVDELKDIMVMSHLRKDHFMLICRACGIRTDV